MSLGKVDIRAIDSADGRALREKHGLGVVTICSLYHMVALTHIY